MTTLAELVAAERQRQRLSLRRVAELSGGLISTTTVHQIETGDRTEVGDDVLDGLAKGLSIPINKVRRAAGVRRPDTDVPFELPRKAQRLNRRERQIILDMIDALLEAKRRG